MIIKREQCQLSATAANGALREALRGKSSPEAAPPTSNSLPEVDCSPLPRTDCQAGSPAESYTKTQPDGEVNFYSNCAHMESNLTDRTTGQCDIPIKS